MINNPGDLLQKYREGKCTPEEGILVERFYPNANIEVQELTKTELEAALNRVLLRSEVLEKPGSKKITLSMGLITVAATIAIVLITVVWMLYFVDSPLSVTYASDIAPGTDKAILTLANGTKINLSDAKSGTLLKQSGIEITKTNDGTLVYKIVSSKSNASGYNTITTPNGGQYKIVLPDGTRVWLNAASSLSYHTSLSHNGGKRKVDLVGEAYFEVSKVKSVIGIQKKIRKMPFIVKTDKQEVIVLGTHFNINSYHDESDTKTTLLEGSVKIVGSHLPTNVTVLKPGDQGLNDGFEIKVKNVDTDEAVAWKDGHFQFDGVGLEAVMRQFSRWYNIEVMYIGDVPKGNYRGQLPRKMSLKNALYVLNFSDIKFKLEGRKLIIRNE